MPSENLSRSEIDGKLRDLKQKLETLRRNYEQFFVGSRERPPMNERRQVERLVRELERTKISNTSQRFRLRSLVQRFTSYRQKWNRVQREIERGTYKPHRERAQKRLAEKKRAERGREEVDVDVDVAEDGSVELEDDLEKVELGELQRELEQMDEDGAFDQYDRSSKAGGDRGAASSSDRSGDRGQGEREPAAGKPAARKRQEERAFQEQPKTEKLDLSAGGDKSGDRREKLQKLRRNLDAEKSAKKGRSEGSSGGGSGGGGEPSREFDKNAQEPTEPLESLASRQTSDRDDGSSSEEASDSDENRD